MNRILKILLVFFIPIPMFCQSYYFNNIYQSETITGSSVHSLIEIENGYLIGGGTGSPQNPDWIQISMIILNSEGTKIDEKLIGDTTSQYFIAQRSIIKTSDNLITYAGSKRTSYPDFPHDEIILVKLNDEYDTLWVKLFGEKDLPYDSAYNSRHVAETANGNLLIVGTMVPHVNYIDNIFLIKTDQDGNKLSEWLYSYPNTTYKLRGFSVIETPDKGYAIGAYRFKPGYNYTGEPMVYKVDSLGNEEWHMDLGGPHYDTKSLVCNGADGNIIETNCYADSMSGSWDAYRTINVKKIDLTGNVIWDKRYGDSEYNKRVSNIRQTNDGDYILTGYTTTAQLGYQYPHFSGWMLKINTAGDSLWYRLYYHINQDFDMNYLYDIVPTNDNGFIACGEISGPSTNYLQHAWVVKVDSMGCDTPGCTTGTQVDELLTLSNKQLHLWPNPASNLVNFQIPGSTQNLKTTLIITNIQGRHVAILPLNATLINWDASGVSNGIYFYRTVVDGEFVSGKIIINK